MSAEALTRVIERGLEELDILIERRQEIIDNNFAKIKDSKNTSLSAFVNNLQGEVESLKMAKMRRENALEWWKGLQEQIEEKSS